MQGFDAINIALLMPLNLSRISGISASYIKKSLSFSWIGLPLLYSLMKRSVILFPTIFETISIGMRYFDLKQDI
jgi:hypothetical protein